MMNKLKSAKVHALRFLFLLPLLSALLLAFRSNSRQKEMPTLSQKPSPVVRPDAPEATPAQPRMTADFLINRTDTVPDDSEPMDTVPSVTTPNEKGYFVDVKGRKSDCVVVVKDKGGKEVKRVLMTDWLKKEKYYTDIYGEIPPPPPPTPPTPPVKPSVLNDQSNDFEITGNNARVTLKDGTIERYDLHDGKQRAAFEKKYGKIITLPTKVATTPTIVGTTEMPVTTIISPTIATAVSPVKVTTMTTPVKATVINAIATKPSLATTVIATPVTNLNTSVRATTIVTPVPPVRGVAVAVIGDEDYVITGKEDLVLTITKNSSREQLEDFKRQMKEKGVELNFDAIDYSAKGILRHISGTMKSKNGECRFSATDFKQLILASDQPYFKVKVEDDKKVVI